MTNEAGKDRRKFARLTCSRFACSCTVRPESNQIESGVDDRRGALLLNVSPEGILFETNFRPAVGDTMRIEIRPIEGPEVAASLRVLHAGTSMKNGFYLIGSAFEKISGHDKQSLLLLLDTISRLEDDLSQE